MPTTIKQQKAHWEEWEEAGHIKGKDCPVCGGLADCDECGANDSLHSVVSGWYDDYDCSYDWCCDNCGYYYEGA